MSRAEIILFEFGLEGGGACVYKLPDNRVAEKGSVVVASLTKKKTPYINGKKFKIIGTHGG